MKLHGKLRENLRKLSIFRKIHQKEKSDGNFHFTLAASQACCKSSTSLDRWFCVVKNLSSQRASWKISTTKTCENEKNPSWEIVNNFNIHQFFNVEEKKHQQKKNLFCLSQCLSGGWKVLVKGKMKTNEQQTKNFSFRFYLEVARVFHLS